MIPNIEVIEEPSMSCDLIDSDEENNMLEPTTVIIHNQNEDDDEDHTHLDDLVN